MLRQTLDAFARSSPRFRRLMMRTWYESLVKLDRDKDITFMNYGYSDLEANGDAPSLNESEQLNRYSIQLYHHVAAAVDLRDKDVVEIGSGRGGGAAYISSNLKPKTMLGIDISRNAVDFCNNYYSNGDLSFSHGDAEKIPLADATVDAVVNLESSHCYGSMMQFLSEVRRILRPGGYFLFSDHRDQHRTQALREQLKDAGLEVERETDITTNVVRALELDNDRKQQMIKRKCPKMLRKEAGEFAALKGTRTFASFKSGESRYLSFVLRKN